MKGTRYVLHSTASCFRKWQNAPRMLTLTSLLICFIIMYAVPFVDNARVQGEPLQCTEVFVAVMNWRFTMLLFSSIIIILFGDLPILEPFTVNSILHGTRRGWVGSQILYIVLTSFLLALLIFAVTIALAQPDITFYNEWSRPVKLLAKGGRISISPERMKLGFSQVILDNYLPWQAFFHSFMLFVLMGCFYGLFTLLMKLKVHSGGFSLLLVVNALTWSVNIFIPERIEYGILSLLSPHYHASLILHSYCAINPALPSIGGSYVIFLCVNALLIFCTFISARHYDIVAIEEAYT
ncbi:MAG: hypothetical protein RR413_10205 [Christensenellaceae bacterium]